MKNKRLLISEDEKKYILSMYGVLNEQTQGNTKKLDIEGKDYFDSGKYSNLSSIGINNLTAELTKALMFLKQNTGKPTSIKIIASEDKDQNWDREQDPSGTNPDYQLEPGNLAKKRAETIKQFLTKFFNEKVQSGDIKTMPTFEQPTIIIGKGTTPAEKQYDRRIEISFSVIGTNFDCLNGMIIGVLYDENTKGWGQHRCNNAIFVLKIRPVGEPSRTITLTSNGKPYASLNNANGIKQEYPPVLELERIEIDTDGLPGGKNTGWRRNYFQISSDIAKQLLQPNNSGIQPNEFELLLQCVNANDIDKNIPIQGQDNYNGGCHKDACSIAIKPASGQLKRLDVIPPSSRGQEIVILTIDSCGNIIQK